MGELIKELGLGWMKFSALGFSILSSDNGPFCYYERISNTGWPGLVV